MVEEVPKSEMETPLVDFQAHGDTTLKQFVSLKRLSVREEFLPRVIQRRNERRNERFTPYPGYKTQRPFENRLSQERNSLAVERTKQVVAIFRQSDEEMLRDWKEELDEEWEAADGKWWKKKTDPDYKLADDHYFDLVRLFNEELHQKYWEEDDWFNLWDHATSNESYLPMEW